MDSLYAKIRSLIKKNNCSLEFDMPKDEEAFVRLVHKAIENDEFEVFYQPQYNYNTKELYGAEALMRWKSVGCKKPSPSEFVPRLEKCGLIYEVDKIIWKKVCADLREWRDMGISIHHLSVNISGEDIYRDDFEEYLVSLLNEYNLEAKSLHLEITETAYVRDLEFMVGIIRSLQDRGFIVEMDDFGSGYSSLKTLKNVPFDIIKLDMELLQESETNEKAKDILTSVIAMFNKIKMPIIVEGVECEEQAKLLNNSGCSYMQGYYFGKPAAKEDFAELLKAE